MPYLRTHKLRILRDPRSALAARLEALASIQLPGQKLLRGLLADKELPATLRVALVAAYEEALKRSGRRLKRQPPVTEPQPANPAPTNPAVEQDRPKRTFTPEELKRLLG